MPLPLRSRHMFQPLPRACCGVLSALLVLAAPAVQAASSKSSRTSKSSKSSKAGSSKAAPATPAAPSTPAPPPAETKATLAPAEELKPAEASPPRPALESKPAVESRPRPALEPKPVVESRPRSTPAAKSAPAPAPEHSDAPGRLRIGVGPDFFLEGARMAGEQGINTSRRDESFDYSSASFLSFTAWLTTPVPTVSERLRVGAGLRIFGNYAAGGSREFGFGILNEAFASGEYGLPVADRTEVVFAGRVGLSFLVPGHELSAEIQRLQEEGVSVWSVPRVGWLVGPSVGARRRMSEHIWLRADLLAQAEKQYLFATSQDISGLHFTKNWNTLALRLGLSIGAEFSL